MTSSAPSLGGCKLLVDCHDRHLMDTLRRRVPFKLSEDEDPELENEVLDEQREYSARTESDNAQLSAQNKRS